MLTYCFYLVDITVLLQFCTGRVQEKLPKPFLSQRFHFSFFFFFLWKIKSGFGLAPPPHFRLLVTSDVTPPLVVRAPGVQLRFCQAPPPPHLSDLRALLLLLGLDPPAPPLSASPPSPISRFPPCRPIPARVSGTSAAGTLSQATPLPTWTERLCFLPKPLPKVHL